MPKDSGAKVSFLAVEKRYGEVWALRPTTFGVGSGEFFAVLGPSGSGKSTLLGVTAGFVPPTRGRLLLNDQDVIRMPPYRREIGMVFQNYSLFPHMTVAENVSFPLRMRRMPRGDIEMRVRQMLDIVRLSGLEDRKPSQLSGGQQQRVALARAAVYNPLLLLMDEPLGALDKNLREAVQDEIKRFQRILGTTVIYVTHDQEEAAAMADRIAIMRSGSIVQIDTPRKLYEQPVNLFVASFLGDANIFAVGELSSNAQGTTSVTTVDGLKMRAATKPIDREKVSVCVRPECVTIGANHDGPDNQFEAEVKEAIYSAGTVRYRVQLTESAVINLRQQVRHGVQPYIPGDKILISWRATDTLLIPES